MMRKLSLAALVLALACGDDDGPGEVDMTVGGDADTETPDMPEVTPDMNEPLTCGDGVLGDDEVCDPGIEDGEGACPTTCDDGDVCTTDGVSGTDCSAMCTNTPITEAITGDGCCPAGALPIDDRDCTGECGNGTLDDGEVCDPGIAAGAPGSCPTACDDGIACTADTLENPGTCMAVCTFADIELPADGDGCCPEGASSATDSDCSATCNDGVVDAGETCDTAIAAGEPGACPTACDDADMCTVNRLRSAGTCNAACEFTPVAAMDGDGCCPPGAGTRVDDDCEALCGDGALDLGETCDDGNTTAGDGCDASCQSEVAIPTGFRITSLEVRDPHVFLSCAADVTTAANDIFQDAIDMNSLDTVGVFRPLDPAATSTPMDVYPGASCTGAGTATMACSAGGTAVNTTANNQTSGVCFAADPAHLSYPATAPNSPMGSCFATTPSTVQLNLNGSLVTMQQAVVAGEYVAGEIRNGVLSGFVSYATAMSTTVSFGTGALELYELLRGGGCPGDDDDPLFPGGADAGWWFYIDFEATEVPWTE